MLPLPFAFSQPILAYKTYEDNATPSNKNEAPNTDMVVRRGAMDMHSMTYVFEAVTNVLNFASCGSHQGYMRAPMVAGDSSDEDGTSDDEDGTQWGHSPTSIVVGSEENISTYTHPSPTSGCSTQTSNQHIPVLGGPFSALIPSMWPQDILGQIQSTEDSGNHPECDFDEFGFKIDEHVDNREDADPCSHAASEDPSMRLKWTAYIESTQKVTILFLMLT